MASSEAGLSGSTVCSIRIYLGEGGGGRQGLKSFYESKQSDFGLLGYNWLKLPYGNFV